MKHLTINIYFTLQKTWTPQHENNAGRKEGFVLKETRFSLNNDNEIALIYIDLRSSAVRRILKSGQLPEDGQVRPKHVAIDVISMLFQIKERLRTFLSCINGGGE
jgi:hypothetical protein